MTIIELVGGARLALPEEPVELKVGLREALLEGQDWREGLSDDICIGVWLWGQWQSTLEPAGFGRDEFVDAVTEYRRELWLWLIGDRIWAQFVSGLAGRVARRMPVLDTGEPTPNPSDQSRRRP